MENVENLIKINEDNTKEFFQDLHKQLNSKTVPQFFSENGNFEYLKAKITHSPTIVKSFETSMEAFSLNKPAIGFLERKVKEETFVYVDRVVISYDIFKGAAENGTTKNVILPYVISMLNNLEITKGFDHNTWNIGGVYASFCRPGHDFKFFTFLNDKSGFEIRLYSDAIKY